MSVKIYNEIDLPSKIERKISKVGQRCPYCREIMHWKDKNRHPTYDHIQPKSKGGRKLVVVCYECNQEKDNMSVFEYLEYCFKHNRRKTFRTFWRLARRAGYIKQSRTPSEGWDALQQITLLGIMKFTLEK
jgi:phage FluMu protein Com